VRFSAEARTIGLCSTCSKAATCGYRALRGFDAVCCEMFDDSGPLPPLRLSHVADTELSKAASAMTHEAESIPLRGLCVNCETRDTCPRARSEGGIWHCREYT
jgi:hypothetical protein